MTRALGAVFLAAWAAVAILVAGAAPLSAVLGTLALFALPGWAWARRLAPGRPREALLVGGLCGVAIGGVLNALLAWALGWHVLLTAAALVALACASLLAPRRERREDASPAIAPRDVRFLLVVGLILLLFLAVPLARNPSARDDGAAYHSLMAHDYLMRGSFSVATELGFPPRDVFLASQPMHNYCLYYSLVAFAMEVAGGAPAPERFVAATDLVLPFLFLVVLFALCRVFLPGRRAWVAVLLGIVAYSYNDLFVLVKYAPWTGGGRLHELAAGYSDLSHGWYRDFLVEPHAVLALVFGMTALALSARALRAHATRHPSVPVGVLLAGAFMADGFLGTLLVLAFGVTYLARRLRRAGEAWVPGPRAWVAMAVSFAVLAGIALATGLAAMGTQTGGLQLRPYGTAWKYGVAIFPIMLGPALLFALWRLVRGRGRTQGEAWGGMWFLAGLCLAAALLVRHSDPEFADLVLRKSVKVMRIPLVLLAAAAWATLAARPGRIVAWVLVLLSLPTPVVDLVTLAGLHAGVPTSTVTRGELEACAWIREHTPRDAVVQGLPEHPDEAYPLSPVAMFGARTMALGNRKMARLSSPSPEAYRALVADVELLVRSPRLEDAVRVMRARGIEYVFVGPRELEVGGDGARKFGRHPSRFEEVYARDGVSIYRLRAGAEPDPPAHR